VTAVVDASALVEYLAGLGRGERVAAVVEEHDDLHLPGIAAVEAASALRGLVRRGQLDEARARLALDDLTAFPAERWPAEPLLARMWELRGTLSAYDATYVALAEALGADLVTCDERLGRAAGDAGARCRVVLP
jgi:predicted nucleic acid-binding protein